ncbi:MAG: hypothetical protein GF353_09820 [Candidatus Lokiarchaeota archaeon]|nr:hypothetical protein [Candidatus Lokiarchaeota archaeon]
MALIPCPECKKKISDSSESCPKCGYKLSPEKIEEIKENEKKSQKQVAIGCAVIFAIFFVIYLICSNSPDSQNNSIKTAEEIRKEEIGKHFSAWDGSHRGLTAYIKKSMHDPSSYEHVETVYWDRGDHLIVKTTFRGKNAFGGVVKNWIQAKVDLNGNVIDVISQGP